jgi:type IV secretion system protein TrbF
MGSSKKKSDQGGGTEDMENPYLQARGVWIERYGSYISQAYNWRLIAILESIALITAMIGLIYVAGQSKFVPYIVAVDKVGMALGVRPAERSGVMDERVVHAEIANFIVNARSVVADRIQEKSNIDAVYGMVLPDSLAHGYLESWYPTHSPFQRMQHGTDQVSVTAILPVSPTSYTVQWTETMHDPHGNVVGTETWEGTMAIAFTPPTDEATILANPLGLYVTSLNWTKKI